MRSRLSIKRVPPTPRTIKGRLLLVAISEVVLLLFFTGFVIYASHRDDVVNANEAKAVDLVKTITEIRFKTFNYVLYHDNLSYSQWQIEHQRLYGELRAYPASDPNEKALIESMQIQRRQVETLFSALNASYSDTQAHQDMPNYTKYQGLLAFRLVSKQQIEISAAFKLSKIKHDDANAIRQQIKITAAIIVALMFLITGINLLFIYGKISKALTVLQYGALKMSKGVFKYRIKYKRKNDEFGVLATSFNKMAANLEQIDKVKSEFVLLVSHQLRTPATAVKGYLSLFSETMHANGLTGKQREILSAAYDENERQIELINEILAVAQVEAGQVILNKKPTDLTTMIDSVIDEQKLFFEEQHQKVEFTKLKNMPLVEADGDRIRIVLENLIRNASKFSPSHGTIEVKLKDLDGFVEIAVKDNGPGISKEDQEKLFKKFSRVGGSSTIRSEGSGLGLYLAKRIVDKHRGDITVSSQVDKGTTFVVRLPK